MKKIVVIGDGGWGTAIALLLHRKGNKVSIWSRFPDYAKLMREEGENVKNFRSLSARVGKSL